MPYGPRLRVATHVIIISRQLPQTHRQRETSPEGADAGIVNVERPEGDGGQVEGHAEQRPQNGFVRDHQVLRPIRLQDLCNVRRTVSATW